MTAPTDSHELTPERVAELHADDTIELIDVREPHEHEAGHIAGARHLQFADLSAAAGSIDKSRPVVFYCRVGARSALATQAFRASGFEAHNMAGGLVAWDQRGMPLEPDAGVVADH